MSKMSKTQQEHCAIGFYWAMVIYPCMFFFCFLVGILFYLPSFMFWDGVIMKEGDIVSTSSGIHLIPYVVWLISWPVFIVASCRMKRWQQIGVSIICVLGITAGLFLVLKLSGMTLRIDVL